MSRCSRVRRPICSIAALDLTMAPRICAQKLCDVTEVVNSNEIPSHFGAQGFAPGTIIPVACTPSHT